MERRITDNIDLLRVVLPEFINRALDEVGNLDDLLEIVLDLGRVPAARFTHGEESLSLHEVTREDLDLIIANIGEFDADNRAGMERTLHRISAIRNRKGVVVGLTCRVGRAVYGTIDIIDEFIASGKSILMLGPPGVGKTTMLREAARVLAETKRVVIVDTSNEIGGDGDVPHPAIGKARRMQVSHPERQHEVMIEAVENHNPEVIVIDEIGRELEAMAARTIAERGVQLIGTAHGNALDNLMLNPTLSDLIGGIESVTLSDDEARRRGTQKTVLERRSPPTFNILVEIQTRNRLVLRDDVSAAVDAILRGSALPVEIRERDENGDIHIESTYLNPETNMVAERQNTVGGRQGRGLRNGNGAKNVNGSTKITELVPRSEKGEKLEQLKIYAYGVARNRLQQAARRLHVPLQVLEDLGNAEAVVTLKQYYRRRPRLIVDAERKGLPIYVLRANTVSQMENFLIDVFKLEVNPLDPFGEALREVEQAIGMVESGAEYVDLAPQEANIRKQQHAMARKANLASQSYGNEPGRHVRIIRRLA